MQTIEEVKNELFERLYSLISFFNEFHQTLAGTKYACDNRKNPAV